MKIGIYLFETFHGRSSIGSSKIRGHWLVKNWPDAEIFVAGKNYDVIIYQKVYHIEHARKFKGFKILDLCDPDWLHWAYRVKEMIEEVDVITTSSENLMIAIKQFTDKPVIYIPDRINLNTFIHQKVHFGDAKSVVWFGYSDNYEVLDPTLSILKKLKLDLVVVSDGLYSAPSQYEGSFKVINYKWKDETAYSNIITGDIALNPRKTTGKWKFKSTNKTLIAWALGLPVATNDIELKKFIKEEERIKEVELRQKELKEKWDIKYSIQQFKEILKNYSNLN
jgi:hypothetical protein